MGKTYTPQEIKKFIIFCKKHVNINLLPGLLNMEVSAHDIELISFTIEDEILQANYQCSIYRKDIDCFVDCFEFAITLDYQVKIK